MPNSLTRVLFVVVSFTLLFQSLFSFVFLPKVYAYLATGGTITTSGEYVIHTFTSSGDFIPNTSMNVEYLIIAGGAGGGDWAGGGGGAGGWRTASAHAVTLQTYPVVVGAGGLRVDDRFQPGQSGGNSSFDGVVSTGGGGGAGRNSGKGVDGGSGGGGGDDPASAGGAGIAGQGFAGGAGHYASADGGGGGGAAAAGVEGFGSGNGGNGKASSISGTSTYYAGGGGGGGASTIGGLGGGGNGNNDSAGSNATGYGSGGGGGGNSNRDAGAGSKGIVIIRYLQPTAPTIGSPSALSTTSIRWNFTDNSSIETGFKVYDNGTPTLKVTCASADLSYCNETSLSPNTSYVRKVVAYKSTSNSEYSSTASKYTLATVPGAPTVNGVATTTLDVNPDPNSSPVSTEMVVYKETGASCDGSGGSYLAADGSDNSSTPVWQAESSWSTVTATGLSESTQYSFCTKSRNGDNTETSWGSAASGTTIESTPPSISSIDSVAGDASATYYDSTDNSSTVIAFTSTDGAGGGVDNCKWDTSDVAYDSMSNSCSSTSSCTVTPSGEGAKTVYLRCQDIYSNKMASSQSVTYTVDATSPTSLSATNSSSSWVSSKPTVTMSTPADATSGLNEIRYVWDSNDLGADCTAGTTTTATANLTSTLTEGSHILYLCASDNAGNVATWNGAYKWDNGNPLVNITTHVSSSYRVANIPAKIEGTASDVISTITDVVISIYNGVNYWTGAAFDSASQAWQAVTGTTTWEYTFVPSSDGDYSIYSKSTDSAANTTTSSETTFTYDTTSPTVSSIISVAGDASATYYDLTDDSSTAVIISTTDGSGTGVDSCKWHTSDVAYDSMSNSCSSTSLCTTNLSSDGVKNIYIRCIDTVGNKMSSSQSVTYTIDATSPTTLSATNPSASWTNSKPTVTVSTPADALSGMNEIRYVWDSNDLGADCSAGTTTTATANLTSTLTEGSHILYLCASDNAGNVATWNGAYKWDNTNPLVSITTHALATYHAANIPAKIEGVASDVLSSISSVALSIYNGVKYWTGTVFDGVSQTWLAVTGTTTWEYTFAPSSDGNYTIYSRSTDGASNQLVSSATTFTYDTIAPSLTVDPSATVTDTSVTVTWTTDESSSTRIEYGLTDSYGTLTTEVDTSPRVTSHSQEITGLASCTNYNYRVKSIDSATNEYVGVDTTFVTTGCTGSATVDEIASTVVTKTNGGSVELTSGGSGIGLVIPANFSSNDSTFQIKELDTTTVILTTSSPTGFTVVGDHTYQLDALSDNSTTVTSFDESITITITYDAEEVSGFDLTTLVIQKWDGSAWIALLDCTVDTVAQTVTCTTSTFSTFGLFGEESSSDSTGSSSSSTPGPSCAGFGLKTPSDLFRVDVTDTSAKLFFTPLLDSTSFHIAYSTKKNTEEFATIVSLDNRGVQNYTINSLNPSTTYYFKIQAVNDCASSGWSNTMKAKTNSRTSTKAVTYYKGNIFSRTLFFLTPSKVLATFKDSFVEPEEKDTKLVKPVEPTVTLEPQGKQFCIFKWCFRIRLPW